MSFVTYKDFKVRGAPLINPINLIKDGTTFRAV